MNGIIEKISTAPGSTAFFYENLVTGETAMYNENLPLIAASVVKLAVMAEFFRQADSGELDSAERHTVLPCECLPSCGALTYLTPTVTLPMLDLCTLMIILSDNTATNILIRRLGIDAINENCRRLGLDGIRLNRLLFDSGASQRGIENYITAESVGRLLGMIYRGELPGSERMLGILKNQRLNGKIPFYLHSYTDIEIAHKTGEDSGITHDCGIVFGENPFIVCYLSNKTDVPVFERIIQDTSYEIYKQVNNSRNHR